MTYNNNVVYMNKYMEKKKTRKTKEEILDLTPEDLYDALNFANNLPDIEINKNDIEKYIKNDNKNIDTLITIIYLMEYLELDPECITTEVIINATRFIDGVYDIEHPIIKNNAYIYKTHEKERSIDMDSYKYIKNLL